MVESKYTIELEKKYGELLPSKSKASLSKFFNIERYLLDDVFDRGLAAARSTGMRPSVKSPYQWAGARMNKYILNVMAYREGKDVKKGRGEDYDLVLDGAKGKTKGRGLGPKQIRPVVYLTKNKNGDAKYIARLRDKTFKFGDKNYRDYVLMNQKDSKYYEPIEAERKRVKENYRRRHKNDRLRKISPGSLSYYILWNQPTMRKSIKDFEDEFKVDVVLMSKPKIPESLKKAVYGDK